MIEVSDSLKALAKQHFHTSEIIDDDEIAKFLFNDIMKQKVKDQTGAQISI